MADVTIKISGDIKNFEKALGEASDATKNLQSQLSSVAKASAVAFAAFTSEIFLSVKAFAESEQASNALTQSLKNQGIFSKELLSDYKAQADALQDLTGVDDDAIVSAQAKLQAYLGQTKITKELTQAVLDLSIAQGIDLEQAATLVGKSIGTSTNALARNGIEVDANASKQEKLSQVIDGINSKFEGQAVAANQGLGALKGLQSAFGDIQKEIGARFAPAIETVIKKVTELFKAISGNKALIDFIAGFVASGVAIAGIIGTIAVAGSAILQFQAVLKALNVTLALTKVAAIGLAGATGIGLLVVGIGYVLTHLNEAQAALTAFKNNVSSVWSGIKEVFTGGGFSAGLDKVTEGATQGLKEYRSELEKINKEAEAENKQTQTKGGRGPAGSSDSAAATGGDAEAPVSSQDFRQVASDISRVASDLARGGEGAASAISNAAGMIADKLLPGIGGAVSSILSILAMGPEKVRELLNGFFTAIPEVIATVVETIPVFLTELLAGFQDFFLNQILPMLPIMIQGLIDGALKFVATIIERVPMIIQTFIASVPGIVNALIADLPRWINELVKLSVIFINALALQAPTIAIQLATNLAAQTPYIATMFALEFIKNIPSMIAVMAQEFLKIPGQFLQALKDGIGSIFSGIGGIFGFAEGGVVTGGIPGVDSVPIMAQPGELMVPPQNFNEVVGAVANQRAGVAPAGAQASGGTTRVLIGFDGNEASRVITARQTEDRELGIAPVSVFA